MRGASSADFTAVQVYTCNGTGAQQWTVASGNTLQALGKCLDVDAAGTANGTTVDLYTCNGTGAQVWVPQSDGALLNPESGKCLDDTGWSTTPGTQAADLVVHRRRQPVLDPPHLMPPGRAPPERP